MKAILTAAVVALLGPCSPADRRPPAPAAVNSPAPPAIDATLPARSYEEMVTAVADLSEQAGIPNLKDVKLSGALTEIRLWKAFGIFYPRCFVLRIENGNPRASFVSPKVAGDKVVFRRGSPVYATTPLGAPRSGWQSLLSYMERNGLDSSVNLAVDERYEPYPDAESLVLEVKNGSRHTMAHYIDSTGTDDGRKAYAICGKIEDEFDVELACKSRTAPR